MILGLCVFLQLFWQHNIQAMRWPISDTNGFSLKNEMVIFLKRLRSIDIYAQKTSEKVNVLAYRELIRSLCVSWRQRHNKGVYRLTHVIY